MRSKRFVRLAAVLVAVSLLIIGGAGAANAATRRVMVNVSLVPDCFTDIHVQAEWTADPDQRFISFRLEDLNTGVFAESNGNTNPPTASAYGWDFGNIASDTSITHRFLATVTIEDISNNVLMRGRAHVRLDCAMN